MTNCKSAKGNLVGICNYLELLMKAKNARLGPFSKQCCKNFGCLWRFFLDKTIRAFANVVKVGQKVEKCWGNLSLFIQWRSAYKKGIDITSAVSIGMFYCNSRTFLYQLLRESFQFFKVSKVVLWNGYPCILHWLVYSPF